MNQIRLIIEGTPVAGIEDDFAAEPVSVRAQNIRRAFAGRNVLDDLDLTIRRGEFVALLGASGSGKTTLLRILGGLDKPDGGIICVPDIRTIVFQEPRLVPARRVWWNVVVGLSGKDAQRERAINALAEVGLERHVDSWPASLSGGEAQRVALARALIRQPELLLLDEPFAALDALTRLKMQRLVGDLCCKHGPATLLVTHDVDEAILLADRVLVLKEGRIAADARVSLPHPRRAAGAAFAALRTQMLEELGVWSGDPETRGTEGYAINPPPFRECRRGAFFPPANPNFNQEE